MAIKKSEYLERANEAFDKGRIDEDTYDSMLMNADIFCDDDEGNSQLPSYYAEVEYTSEQLETDPEAIEGAKWDDKNYLHYMER